MSFVKLTMGERIEDLMIKKDVTSVTLSKETGVSEATISDIINGVDKGYSYKHFVKIANYFNVSTDYLFGLTDNATTDKDLRFVCDYTGLNEEAVESLREIELQRNVYAHYYDGEYGIKKSKDDKNSFNNKLINSYFYLDFCDSFSEVQFFNLLFMGALALVFEDYDEFYLLFPEYRETPNFIYDFFEKFGYHIHPNDCKLAIFDIQNGCANFAKENSLIYSEKQYDVTKLKHYIEYFSDKIRFSENVELINKLDELKAYEDKYFPFDEAKKHYQKVKERYHKIVGDKYE